MVKSGFFNITSVLSDKILKKQSNEKSYVYYFNFAILQRNTPFPELHNYDVTQNFRIIFKAF